MSTDRELLELAAKAAGMTDWKFTGTGMAKMLDPSRPETTGSIGRGWDPLTDDGDALRLAVKLEMDIFFNDGDTDVLGVSEGGGDPFERTRRAIVRAAASIGEQLP
jgi:hypothetical protein